MAADVTEAAPRATRAGPPRLAAFGPAPRSTAPAPLAVAVSSRKARYVELRATGLTIKEAGRAAGLGYRTARRYDRDPAVRARLDALEGAAVAAARGALVAGAVRAATRLLALLEPGAARSHREGWLMFRAATTVLRYVLGDPGATCPHCGRRAGG